jgi:hypothetical protein
MDGELEGEVVMWGQGIGAGQESAVDRCAPEKTMTGVLLQILPPNPARVAPLPGPPLIEQALLEQPWYIAGTLTLAGIVVFLALNQRGRSRAGVLWAGGLMVSAAAILVIGLLVKTEREQMAEATRSLVDATARSDMRALDAWLGPDATLFSEFRAEGLSVPRSGLDKAGILKAAPEALARWPLKDYRVEDLQAQSLGPGLGRTQVSVRVVPEAMPLPHTSWWRVGWRRSPDGAWRVTEIEPLDIPYAGR